MAEKRIRRSYTKKEKIKFFKELSEALDRKIELVLAGGTVMIIL